MTPTSITNGQATKQHQLRALNQETQDLQVALNRVQTSASYALKLVEQSYHRKRSQILNGHDQDPKSICP